MRPAARSRGAGDKARSWAGLWQLRTEISPWLAGWRPERRRRTSVYSSQLAWFYDLPALVPDAADDLVDCFIRCLTDVSSQRPRPDIVARKSRSRHWPSHRRLSCRGRRLVPRQQQRSGRARRGRTARLPGPLKVVEAFAGDDVVEDGGEPGFVKRAADEACVAQPEAVAPEPRRWVGCAHQRFR